MAKLVQLTNSETNENIYAKTPLKAVFNADGSNISAINGILKGDGTGNISVVDETEVELVDLPYICHDNILDNWYFPNPVDQRAGHIIFGGTLCYSDEACTQNAEAAGKNYEVTKISNGNYTFVGQDGLTWYVPAASVFRGYTGAGYTVDRWLTQTPWGDSVETVTVEDGCIKLASIAIPEYPTSYGKWQQIIEAKATLVGKVVTAAIFVESVVSGDGPGVFLGIGDSPTVVASNEVQITAPGVYTVTTTWTEAVDRVYVRVSRGATTPAEVSIRAIKLELGSQQTLAHQENGVWVLNEMPDYGEQLRRCQRYCFVWGYGAKKTRCLAVMQCVQPSRLFGLIPTPVTMRANPVMTGGSLTTFGGKVTSLDNLITCANGIRAVANIEGTSTSQGQAVGIENADDNGRVIFSADL